MDKENLNNLKLLRWDEMPEFDIYNDQLLSIINDELINFEQYDENIKVTKSMINNYVKNEIIPKPNKKKYNKTHIAYVIMITFFKNILSISEIKSLLNYLTKNDDISIIYDLFVNIFENTLNNTFKDSENKINYKNDKLIPLQKICLAISCKYYTKDFLKIVNELN